MMGTVNAGTPLAESDGVTVDMTFVDVDSVPAEGVWTETGRATADSGSLLLMGGGRGFVALAGLMEAVEREGRSGSV